MIIYASCGFMQGQIYSSQLFVLLSFSTECRVLFPGGESGPSIKEPPWATLLRSLLDKNFGHTEVAPGTFSLRMEADKAGPSPPVGIWWDFSSWRLGGEQAVLVGGVFAASEQAAQRSATGVCSDSHPPLPCSALGSVWMLQTLLCPAAGAGSTLNLHRHRTGHGQPHSVNTDFDPQ